MPALEAVKSAFKNMLTMLTTRESYPGLKAQTIEEPPGASPFDHVRLQPLSPPAAAGPWLLALGIMQLQGLVFICIYTF